MNKQQFYDEKNLNTLWGRFDFRVLWFLLKKITNPRCNALIFRKIDKRVNLAFIKQEKREAKRNRYE